MEINMKKRFEFKDLPDMQYFRDQGKKLASQITIGKTLFMKEHNVSSEAEYKRRCMKTGHIMKHSHIGYNNFAHTAECMVKIYEGLKARGSYLDRFGFQLDTLMSLPEEYRKGQIMGTGQMFRDADEWMQIGQVVPVQPHCGDYIIGIPNSIENATNALKAGGTSLGNLAHYYTCEVLGIDIEERRAVETCTALAIMGEFKDAGAVLHSNLDDGFGGQMHDLANLAGFARLERYYAEDLNGLAMTHCFGNLFSNPMSRIIFNLAMADLSAEHNGAPGSMIYGNTTDFGFDLDSNYGVIASYSMADIICQLYRPTGHAVTAVPTTEAVRIPVPEEVIQSNIIVDRMIKKAPLYAEFIDWNRILAEKDLLLATSRVFFERVMNGLDGMGVDIEHTGQIMAALKAIGPAQLEEAFGVGKAEKNAMRGRLPLRPTNVIVDIMNKQENLAGKIDDLEGSLKGVKIIVGSSDLHEYGKEVIKYIMLQAGAKVFDLGYTVATQDLVDTIIETESRIVLISTYNGIALSYARELTAAMAARGIKNILLVMGGLLNENPEEGELAVDVTGKLKELGVNTDNNAETLVSTIRRFLAEN